MIRLLIVVFFLVAHLQAATNIDAKINKASKNIKSFDRKNSSLNSKIKRSARAILTQKRKILTQKKRMQELETELQLKEEKYLQNKKELDALKRSQKTLLHNQNELEQKIIFAIARNISIGMLFNDNEPISEDDIITEEALKSLSENIRRNIKLMNAKFYTNQNRIDSINQRVDNLQKSIFSINEKKKRLKIAQKENQQSLKQLKRSKKSYQRQLSKILKQQSALQSTLAELKIIKKEEAKKAKARAEANRKKLAARSNNEKLPKVNYKSTSFKNIKTKHYRGKKTIAPLESYYVSKSFGPYKDPIYGIDIFNESVSLKSKRANAKVKNVLNGKVILAKKTSLLENIVIMEHSNGIHTIYAHLSQIAPNVKKGKKLKKGAILGRIEGALMFEVTQKNYHINPMRLIQ